MAKRDRNAKWTKRVTNAKAVLDIRKKSAKARAEKRRERGRRNGPNT